MRILYYISSFKTGGVESFLVDIINTWVDDDEITLCIITDDYNNNLLKNIKRDIDILYLRKSKKISRKAYFKQYLEYIKRKKIDIINCQDIESLCFSATAKLVRPKMKLYITIHEYEKEVQSKKIYTYLTRLLLRKVIVVSDLIKNNLIKDGIDAKKIEVVCNGVKIDKYKNKKINCIGNNIKIACISRIIPDKKGQDILIRSIEKVKEEYNNVKCYLLGDVIEEDKLFLLYLKKIIKSLKLDKNIVFVGAINNVPSFLNDMDILVVPSRSEGLGLTVLEGMAARVPVIGTNINSIKSLIKNDEYGDLFTYDDYHDLSQ